MKKIIYLAIVAFLVSCSSSDNTEKPKDENIRVEKIRVIEVQPQKFEHFIEVNGSVEAANDAYISPEMNGQIKKIHVQEGEHVKKGQLLVTLNTSVIKSSINEVKTGLELAKKLYSKQKELWGKNIGSEIQYLQAKNNMEQAESRLKTLEAQLDMAMIKAPFDGIVDEIYRKEGELGVPGMQLMQLVNLSKLYINADISESYLSKVKKGDSVEVSFPSYPDKKLTVPLYRTGNVINKDNRTFKIQLRINNPDGSLKPNIISVLKINDYSNDSALVVPSIILKRDVRNRFFFFIVNDKNGKQIAKPIFIEQGKSYKDQSEIIQGLKPGMKVIVQGYNKVSSGTQVEIVD
jgi:membrane fusion protein (multidrug efflux system)